MRSFDSVVSLSVHPLVVCRPRASRNPVTVSAEEFARFSPAQLDPTRRTPGRTGAESFAGRWWFASVRRHVGFASLGERRLLMLLDYSGNVLELERDPCIVIPARNAPPTARPWLYAAQGDQSRTLFAHGTGDGLEELASVFATTPITVSVAIERDQAELPTITWLSAYRFSRCRLGADRERSVVAACVDPRPLGEVIHRVDADEPVARAGVYSLLWHRCLMLEASATPPSDASLVVAA